MLLRFSNLALALVLASCSSHRSPVMPGAKPRDHGAIGATEGPVWKDGSLYFTDGKHINRMGSDGRTTVFRHNASNGLLFDKEGRLVACESGMRRVTRTEKDGSITVMADRFEGKRFNSPNDLCMDSKGRIYFTDPRYGSRKGMEIHDKTWELSPVFAAMRTYIKAVKYPSWYETTDLRTVRFYKTHKTELPPYPYADQHPLLEGIFRINRDASAQESVCSFAYEALDDTHILCDGAEQPIGMLNSPGCDYLYIADNNKTKHGGARKLLRYAINKDGKVEPKSRTVTFDWKDGCGPSAMKIDSAGRIHVIAGTNKATEYETTRFKAGCYILSPSGHLLDFIPFELDKSNYVTRIHCEGAERPNGILISPDDHYLYIADNNNSSHGGSRKLLRYTLDKNGDVKPGSRKVIFDWKDGRGPDGMKMDREGRIYVAAGTNKATEFETTSFKAGCYILSPSGRLLDFIPTAPDECCNCAFGGKDGKTLFITSGGHLWSVPLR